MGRIGGMGAVVLVSMGAVQPSSAQQTVMSAAGYSGYSITPTAHILPWGSASLGYDNQVNDGPTRGAAATRYKGSADNLIVGIGLFPNIEISGRLAANSKHANCYAEDCGIRDLSFNFKVGLPLDKEERWNVAVGANDYGGFYNYFRTMYGVISYSPENFDFSLGYARRGTDLQGRSQPLDGVFGSAAYQPLPWMQAHVEYNASRAWTGVRLFAPSDWLPAGWSANVGVNARIAGDQNVPRSWLSAGLTVPLYRVPTTRAVSAPASMPSPSPAPSPPPTSQQEPIAPVPSQAQRYVRAFSAEGLVASSAPPANSGGDAANTSVIVETVVTDEQLVNVAEELRIKGFEDISVGRMANGAIAVRVNNATYNVNTVDGLGVALGVVARHLGSNAAGYRLVLTQRQLAIIGVTGRTDCLADWVAMKPARCAAGKMYAPGFSDVAGLVDSAQWVVDGKTPSWATARVILQPVLATNIGSEYGLFDYSAGVRATIQQPLWKGAYAEVSHVSPVGEESRNYRPPQGVFSGNRVVSQTDRVLLHQVMRVPVEKLFGEENAKTAARWGADALTAHVAAGRINSLYEGVYGELRWEPFEGRHRFGLEGGRFERRTDYDRFLPMHSRSLLASYRYSFAPTKTDIELTGGQFLYNDKGAQFMITQWFDDVSVSLYYRRTKYDFERTTRNFAGIELSIPLTPRKDMTPAYHVQVTGVPQWYYGLETRVGSLNFVSTNQGVFPGVAVLDRTFNYDRSGVGYFEDNMARIRSAASK